LRRDAEAILPLYADGRRLAPLGLCRHDGSGAAGRLPADCPYTLDEICRQDWYPPPPGLSGSGESADSRTDGPGS
jgi:hypothetical protein